MASGTTAIQGGRGMPIRFGEGTHRISDLVTVHTRGRIECRVKRAPGMGVTGKSSGRGAGMTGIAVRNDVRQGIMNEISGGSGRRHRS